MKLAIVGDVHIADVAPATRKDDYKQTCLNKLKFIIDYVNNDSEYQAILFVGDLFHKKVPFHNSHSMLSSLIDLFKSSKVPLYIVPGNHDIHGNMATFANQPLNVLIQAGVIKMLNGVPYLIRDDEVLVSLNGSPYSPIRDSKDSAIYYNLNHEGYDVKISMFHQMLLPDDKKFFTDYINFSDLKDINADIVICGHYHEGYNPSMIKQDNKIFINPGSITRGTAEQANYEKVPKFVELELYKVGYSVAVKYKDIEIPYVPSSEIFDFNVIERNKKKKDMHEFMDGLSEMESQSLSTQEPQGIINALKLLGMEDRLVPIAQGYLDEAYDSLTV